MVEFTNRTTCVIVVSFFVRKPLSMWYKTAFEIGEVAVLESESRVLCTNTWTYKLRNCPPLWPDVTNVDTDLLL